MNWERVYLKVLAVPFLFVGVIGVGSQIYYYLKAGDWAPVSFTGPTGLFGWAMDSGFVGIDNIVNGTLRWLNPFMVSVAFGVSFWKAADEE